MSLENCQLCNKSQFKYTCPRCNIIYCSVGCYKSEQHLKCSEEFYKQCVQDELSLAGKTYSNADMRKIYEILKRLREKDAGLDGDETFEFDDLDSDDEAGGERMHDENDEDENNDDDIADRLKGIDINDADEVWQRLTPDEREEFKKLVSSGGIMKLIPDFKPWWIKNENSKITVLNSNDESSERVVPKVLETIPQYSRLCSKEPAPCLHYNLWNILASYSCTVRYFNGEHLTNPNEATACIINLSSTLKYGTNFETVNDAIVSVEMEALTTGNGATQLMPTTAMAKSLIIDDPTQLKYDAQQLMAKLSNKLSALSDIYVLLQSTKKALKLSKKGAAEFQKLFAISSGMEELNYFKIQQLIKKIQFYLSYVNRENESNLQ